MKLSYLYKVQNHENCVRTESLFSPCQGLLEMRPPEEWEGSRCGQQMVLCATHCPVESSFFIKENLNLCSEGNSISSLLQIFWVTLSTSPRRAPKLMCSVEGHPVCSLRKPFPTLRSTYLTCIASYHNSSYPHHLLVIQCGIPNAFNNWSLTETYLKAFFRKRCH